MFSSGFGDEGEDKRFEQEAKEAEFGTFSVMEIKCSKK